LAPGLSTIGFASDYHQRGTTFADRDSLVCEPRASRRPHYSEEESDVLRAIFNSTRPVWSEYCVDQWETQSNAVQPMGRRAEFRTLPLLPTLVISSAHFRRHALTFQRSAEAIRIATANHRLAMKASLTRVNQQPLYTCIFGYRLLHCGIC
jgi:hypothetical protein